MKTKATRIVDPAGRVSIPGYLRELVGIKPGDAVSIQAGEDNTLLIQAIGNRCCVCGEIHDGKDLFPLTHDLHERLICPNCARKLIDTFMKDREGTK